MKKISLSPKEYNRKIQSVMNSPEKLLQFFRQYRIVFNDPVFNLDGIQTNIKVPTPSIPEELNQLQL